MNKNIAKPLIIQFTSPEMNPGIKRSQNSIFVPANTPWVSFKNDILPLVDTDTYDSVLVHTKNDINRDIKGVVGNISIKMNALSGAATKVNKPVLAYDTADAPFYLMNPTKDDMNEAGIYAPSDDTIMEKYNSFESDAAWQEHQDKIWGRMKDMMPLSRKEDKFNRNHAAQLKDPKRGLEDKDLGKFWSFRPRKNLAPTVMGDDMVGMPSVEGREYEGFTMVNKKPDGDVEVKPLIVRSLTTTGASGIMIPMANADGKINKHQIATDMSPWGMVLHFRASDGITVQKNHVLNKETKEYDFKFGDGSLTHLKITDVSPNGTITMQDARGLFNIKPKQEIIGTLKDRGYVVPELIASVKVEQNGKYVWQSPGTMTGSQEVLTTVSPSNPGYIIARPPKNGEDKYVVLVAEGALKGHIVAKYVDVKDKEGVCFGDKIAGDRGLIVTQVPGVSEAYIKNALTIYDKYDIKGTYIAMDADGRENRNVALGIHKAYNYISEVNPTTVLSWDPAQKGMDDALLAVAQGKITVKEMKLVTGLPDVLFPLENARVMTPYSLDGEQQEQPAWQTEYEESKKIRKEKVAAAQAETMTRQEQKNKLLQQGQKDDLVHGGWVETPQDIANLQRITVTKAAEMADAMNGRIPAPKQASKISATPDVDELAVNGDGYREEIKKNINNKLRRLAQEWDMENPPMTPVNPPDDCKAVYKYRQPVIDSSEPGIPNFRDDTEYEAQGKWGIVTVNTENIMTPQEKEERQKELKDGGFEPIGNMRLVEQILTLDKELVRDKNKDAGLEQ